MEDEKMSDEFKDVSTVPTLTLEPFQPEAEKQAVVKTEEPPMEETILTEEELVRRRRWQISQSQHWKM